MNTLLPINASFGSVLLPIQQQIPLALSEDADLKWIGFSAPNSCLITMDSNFMLRLLLRGGGNTGVWQPIFNGEDILAERAPDDSIWPIVAMERNDGSGVVGQFRYVLCKGSSYPSATKTLVPLTVDWKLPVLAQVFNLILFYFWVSSLVFFLN